MHPIVQRSEAYVLLAALLAMTGCSGGDTTTLMGTVVFRGQPLANGSVIFFPEKGQPINAAIDSAGAYSTEIPSGEYRVVISGPGVVVPAGWKEGSPDPPPPKLVLPPEYASRAKTKLKVTVTSSGSQTEDFNLK